MGTLLAVDATTSHPAYSDRPSSRWVATTASGPTPGPGHAGPSGPVLSAPARGFLARYARTLAVLLISMALVLVVSSLVSTTEWVSSHPWSTATAATTGWVLAVAPWLRRRGWRRGTVHAVTWAAPTALLLPLVLIGWVSPGALILWGPLTSLFAVACAMAAAPDTVTG